jgi:tetratricopeptide (TPR) repeat protein
MFEQDADSYYEKAIAAAEDENYLSALHYARRVADVDQYSDDAYMLTAEIYAEMGLFHRAVSQYFKILALDEGAADCYIAIGQNYYMMGANIPALNFIKRGIDCACDSEYLIQARAMLDEISEGPRFRLVSAEQNHEFLLSMAKSLMADNDFESAGRLLNFVPEDSGNYCEAVLQSAICSRYNKDYERSKELTLKALETEPGNVIARCNYAGLLLDAGDAANGEAELDALESDTGCGASELYCIAITMLDAERENTAARFFEKFLALEPYSENVLMLLGQVYYNLGDLDAAQNCMLTVLSIDPESIVARYYNKYFQSARKRRKPKLRYSRQIPSAAANKLLAELWKTGRMSDDALTAYIDEKRDFFDTVLWMYKINRLALAELVSLRLAVLPDRQVSAFLRLCLADTGISNMVKKSILTAILKSAPPNRLALVVDDDIRFLSSGTPKILADADYVIKSAYCSVFAATAFIAGGFERKLNAMLKRFFKEFSGLLYRFDSAPELACVFAYRLGGSYFSDKITELAGIFNADEKLLKYYLELTGVDVNALFKTE